MDSPLASNNRDKDEDAEAESDFHMVATKSLLCLTTGLSHIPVYVTWLPV